MKTLLSAAAVAALAVHAHAQLVINELLVNTTSTDTEFIELYNPTAAAIDLSDWTLKVYESDSGAAFGTLDKTVTIPAGRSIGAGAHFLLASPEFVNVFPPTIVDVSIPNNTFENSSFTLILEDPVGTNIYSVFVTDGGAGDAANEAGLGITPDLTVGPDGTFLPAGYYLTPDGGTTPLFLEFSPRPAPSATPRAANPTAVPLTLGISPASVAESAGFAAAVGTVSRPGTTGDLEVTITGDDATEAVPVVGTVTILDGMSSATFDIDAVDDLFPDGTQTVTFEVSAPAAFGDTATLDVTDDAGDSFSLVLNEIYSRPDTTAGDANGDGTIGNAADEFIEIVNVTASPVDLTGAKLTDAVRDIHFFTDGTILQPGCALVVFGGGDFFQGTVAGAFGNAEVQKSSEGLLFLTDSGDTVSIVDASSGVRHEVRTPNVSGDPELGSYNLNTDADAASGYDRHTVIAANAANQFSPGTTVAGTAFCPAPAQALTLSVTPGSFAENAGAGAATATVSIPAPLATDLLVFLETGDEGEVVPQFPGAFISAGLTSADIPLDAVDDVLVDGTQTVTLSAFASGYTNGTTTVDVTDDGDTPAFTGLVINEVDADQPGTDTTEFIELYNLTGNAESLDGLVLVLFNGSDDASYNAFDLTGQTIPANGYLVVGNAPGAYTPANFPASNAIQNGPDAVAIYVGSEVDFPNDTAPGSVSNVLVDAMVYGTADGDDAGLIAAFGGPQYDEGSTNNATSNSRVPDGTGSFVAQAPTPGAANQVVIPDSPQILTITPDFGGGTVNMSIANVSPGTTYSLNSTPDLTETIPFTQLLTFDPGVNGFEDPVGSGIYVFDFPDGSISGKPKNFYQVSNP
ncbi:MAG: lamin tail domain-containing protein [Akkermansiaceae bacterium]|nr:lamin tail domain-containing protein [Akkermansiaceae bacterium]NNM30909.1 lamin tail domain-containing protein [Akkermansiaceae bacterium]